MPNLTRNQYMELFIHAQDSWKWASRSRNGAIKLNIQANMAKIMDLSEQALGELPRPDRVPDLTPVNTTMGDTSNG